MGNPEAPLFETLLVVPGFNQRTTNREVFIRYEVLGLGVNQNLLIKRHGTWPANQRSLFLVNTVIFHT